MNSLNFQTKCSWSQEKILNNLKIPNKLKKKNSVFSWYPSTKKIRNFLRLEISLQIISANQGSQNLSTKITVLLSINVQQFLLLNYSRISLFHQITYTAVKSLKAKLCWNSTAVKSVEKKSPLRINSANKESFVTGNTSNKELKVHKNGSLQIGYSIKTSKISSH